MHNTFTCVCSGSLILLCQIISWNCLGVLRFSVFTQNLGYVNKVLTLDFSFSTLSSRTVHRGHTYGTHVREGTTGRHAALAMFHVPAHQLHMPEFWACAVGTGPLSLAQFKLMQGAVHPLHMARVPGMHSRPPAHALGSGAFSGTWCKKCCPALL